MYNYSEKVKIQSLKSYRFVQPRRAACRMLSQSSTFSVGGFYVFNTTLLRLRTLLSTTEPYLAWIKGLSCKLKFTDPPPSLTPNYASPSYTLIAPDRNAPACKEYTIYLQIRWTLDCVMRTGCGDVFTILKQNKF